MGSVIQSTVMALVYFIFCIPLHGVRHSEARQLSKYTPLAARTERRVRRMHTIHWTFLSSAQVTCTVHVRTKVYFGLYCVCKGVTQMAHTIIKVWLHRQNLAKALRRMRHERNNRNVTLPLSINSSSQKHFAQDKSRKKTLTHWIWLISCWVAHQKKVTRYQSSKLLLTDG